MVMNKNCLLSIIILAFLNASYVLSVPINTNLDSSRPEILCEKYIRQIEKDLNGDPYKGEVVMPYVSEDEVIIMQEFIRPWVKKLPYNDLYSNPHYVNQIINSALIEFIRIKTEKIAAITIPYSKQEIINAGKTESNNFMQALSNSPRRKGFDLNGYFGANFERRVKENAMNGQYRY